MLAETLRYAVILPSSRRVEPFMDRAAECPVLNERLGEVIQRALQDCGLEIVDRPPDDAACLAVSDRTWITPETIRCLLAQWDGPGRVSLGDSRWHELLEGLQDLPAPGVYELGVLPPGSPPSLDALEPRALELDVSWTEPPPEHWALAHARPDALPSTACGLHQVDHWTHLLRISWLALAARGLREQRAFEALPWPLRLWRGLGFLLKAGSVNPYRIAAALSQQGEGCRIHPTAVVEASQLGAEVEVGPFAVVRGSILGDGVKVEAHCMVQGSVMGTGSRLGRRGTLNLCVLMEGANLAAGNGYQATILGRESFIAWSATVFDFSFDRSIRVWKDGERQDSEQWFLGAAIGHRARVGGMVVLGYGSAVPNETLLVGDPQQVLRSWEEGEGPHRVEQGWARPVSELRSSRPKQSPPVRPPQSPSP